MHGSTAPLLPHGSRRSCGVLTDLLTCCGRGDEAAFGRLFDVFHRLVLAAVGQQGSREVTEEHVVRAFVHLWRQAPTYDAAVHAPIPWVMHEVSMFLLAGDGHHEAAAVPA